MRKRKKLRMIPALICILAVLAAEPQVVMAGTWDNAKTFYNTYGNSVVFKSTSSTDGLIYFATRGSTASTNTKYKTIGWKMTIKNSSGTTLQTIYYKLGGSYMTNTDCQITSDYKYNLYSLSLYNIKRRLNTKATAAMNDADMEIVLNACMVVEKKNKAQGAMSDSGPTSGTVYTTYSGISGAEKWSSSSKTALKSYFNKTVDGLFVKVSATGDSGIKSISGKGTYFYGTYVTLSANLKTGYEFNQWTGSKKSTSSSMSFYATSAISCKASSTKKKVDIVFHRNLSTSDSTTNTMTVNYGDGSKTFTQCGWTKNGYSISGWSLSSGSSVISYSTGYTVTDSFVKSNSPRIDLYAVYPTPASTPSTPTPSTPTPSTPTPSTPTPSTPTPSTPTPSTPTPSTPTPSTPTPSTPTPSTPTPSTPTPGTETPSTPTPGTEDTTKTGTKKIKVRFISSKYFEDDSNNLISESNGGLAADSKWATEGTLRALLRSVLKK
jgi:hypothetical protein